MSNIEKNALRIAELLGYKKVLDMYCKNGQSFHEHKIETFSSYNGLMPIVFECNGGEHYGITINWSVRLTDKTNGKNLYYDFRVGLKTETEFIESIQQACIKYLELKNGNN